MNPITIEYTEKEEIGDVVYFYGKDNKRYGLCHGGIDGSLRGMTGIPVYRVHCDVLICCFPARQKCGVKMIGDWDCFTALLDYKNELFISPAKTDDDIIDFCHWVARKFDLSLSQMVGFTQRTLKEFHSLPSY
jgi:hypothetical protein